MNTKAKHRFRLDCVLSCFENAVFITLTTADICDLSEIRARWRIFRHDYFRSLGFKARYVQVYEPHPNGHGWHIHFVVDKGFLPVSDIRRFSGRAGFGRIHIERVYDVGKISGYLGKYLSKGINNIKSMGVRRCRLVNISRGLTRLVDISVRSDFIDKIKACLKCDIAELRGWLVLDKYHFILAYVLFGSYFHEPIFEYDEILSSINFSSCQDILI